MRQAPAPTLAWTQGRKECVQSFSQTLIRPRAPATCRRLCVAAACRPLLIDNYDSYTYNLAQLIGEVYDVEPLVIPNDCVDLAGVRALLAAREVQHIILSPGPGSPHTPADIGVCMDVLRHCPDTPLLGVCLGHQALAAAAGGRVVRAPEPVHGRLSTLTHTGHSLFAGLPSGPGSGFDVVRYHSLAVCPDSLPQCLVPIAWTDGHHHALHDSSGAAITAGIAAAAAALCPDVAAGLKTPAGGGKPVLMALAHASRPHFGLQFHPESVATAYGLQLLANFRALAADATGHRRPPPSAALARHAARSGGVVARGPPGRALPPRPWPSQQQHVCTANTARAPAAALLPAAGGRVLRLAWRRLGGILELLGGPQALYEAVIGPGPDTFWLDSSAAPERCRFSYMGGAGLAGPLWQRVTYKVAAASAAVTAQQQQQQQQQRHAVCHPPGELRVYSGAATTVNSSSSSSSGDGSGSSPPPAHHSGLSVWDYLDAQLAALQLAPDDAAAAAKALPFNFWGGFVGYLGYELKAECGGQPAHESAAPDAAWLFADRVLALDHSCGDVYLLALSEQQQQQQQQQQMSVHDGGAADPDALAWLQDIAARITALLGGGEAGAAALGAACLPARAGDTNPGTVSRGAVVAAATASASTAPAPVAPQRPSRIGTAGPAPPSTHQELPGVLPWHNAAGYAALVESCQRALFAGESYELCLTSGYSLAPAPPPWALYSALRSRNPAPYSAWLRVAASTPHEVGAASWPGVAVCCSSPERFLAGLRGGLLEARPIKGTALRVPGDAAADAAAAAALASSPKEVGENLMIADLLRNDLGRVCEPGSVHVPSLVALESYASVHQLVSTVRGLRSPGVSAVAAVRAAFPGGSMTGAPKVRSMALLDDLEGRARGVYSGALGFLSVNDTFDLNIVIRSAVYLEPEASCGSSPAEPHAMSVGAGGAVVVGSDPAGEHAEMALKAAPLLAAAVDARDAHAADSTRAAH